MKNIFRSILVAVAMLAGVTAWANTTITLTPEQAAQLAKQADTASTVQGVSQALRTEANAWGEMGANMGKAMVGAAKELGIAANEFAQTPLGKVTVALVIYKIAGEDIASKVVGLGIMLFMFSVAVWLLRTSRFSEVKYEFVPILWGALTVKREVECKTSRDAAIGKMLGAFVSSVIGLLVGLGVMF